MQDRWPPTPLGNILEPVVRRVSTELTTEYRLLGVRLEGDGPFLRETKLGSQISAKSLNEVKTGDFIYSRLFAWRGAFGIITDELDGCYVSNEFPLFRPIIEQIDVRFLNYWFRLRSVINKVEADCSGSTPLTRNRYKEEFLLRLEIPLPPLSEQRRIVAKIEQLAAKIEEAWGFRENAINETGTLIQCALHQFFEVESSNWKQMPMTEAIVINDRQVDPTLPEYSQLPHISGENIESKTCKLLPYRSAEADGVKSANYLFFPNTILYSKIRPYLRKAVYVDFQGVCSADIYPIKLINDELEPRFFMWSLVAGPFTQFANLLSGRTRMPKLNRKQLFAFGLYYPTLNKQRRIVAYLDGLQAQVDRLKVLQAQTAAELEALLPSILDQAFKGEL